MLPIRCNIQHSLQHSGNWLKLLQCRFKRRQAGYINNTSIEIVFSFLVCLFFGMVVCLFVVVSFSFLEPFTKRKIQR